MRLYQAGRRARPGTSPNGAPTGAVANEEAAAPVGAEGAAGGAEAGGVGAQGTPPERSWSIAAVLPPDADADADGAPSPSPTASASAGPVSSAPEGDAAPGTGTGDGRTAPPGRGGVAPAPTTTPWTPALAPAALPAPPLPRMRPIGGWEHDVAPVPHEERRRRGLLRALWLAVAALVVAAAVVLAVGLSLPPPVPRTAGPSPAGSLARALGLRLGDFPAGWTASPTPTGPLGALLGVGAGAGLAPGTHPAHGLAAAFASCAGRSPSHDVLVGPAGARASARRTSDFYSGPPTQGAMGAASVTSVYASASEVRAAAGELADPRFDRCFGDTVGGALLRGAESVPAGAGATFGSLTVLPLALPRRVGARAAGADLSVPVAFGGGQSSVEVCFVFVAGGRVEETLVSYAAGAPFPPSLTRTLTAALERGIAAAGRRD